MTAPPVYPGTSQEIVPGDRASALAPGTDTPWHIDIARVVFTDDEAHVSNESHPENLVPVAWLTYVGPTPDRWLIEVAPGTLTTDTNLLDGIDVSPGPERDALDRVIAALRAAVSVPAE